MTDTFSNTSFTHVLEQILLYRVISRSTELIGREMFSRTTLRRTETVATVKLTTSSADGSEKQNILFKKNFRLIRMQDCTNQCKCN